MSPQLPDAVVFDFDGLIVDTETPIFQASQIALASLGHQIGIEAWATVVGLGDDDSFTALCRAVGSHLDRHAYEMAYRAQDTSWRHTQPALPGVITLLDELATAGVACGVSSSSPAEWIEGHLGRLGLRRFFRTVASVDRVGGRSKPAPDSYLLACQDLAVDPARAVALEDSAHGIAAALAAGLMVVAVPSHITQHTDLSAAHLTVGSLEDVSLADLAALVETPGAI